MTSARICDHATIFLMLCGCILQLLLVLCISSNNGATAAVMDTIKCILDRSGGEQSLECRQRITLQYNDAICLELCLSCKITLNQSCAQGVCCADVADLSCNFEPDHLTGCGVNSTDGVLCEARFRVIAFENNITNLSIIYNDSTYDTNVMHFPEFNVVNCSDIVVSSSSSLMEPSHATSFMMSTASSAIFMATTTSTSLTSSVSESTTTPTPSQPSSLTVIIAIGGLAGVILFLVILFVSIAIFCIIRVIRQKKAQRLYEMRNRATSHTYVCTQPNNVTVKAISSTNFDVPSTHSREDMEMRSQSFSPGRALPEEPEAFREHLKSDMTFNRREQSPLPPDPLSLSYNRWLTVFSSVIVKKENLGMSEDAIGEGAFGKVYKGQLKMKDQNGDSVERNVAVKTLKANPTAEQIEEFISESAVMLDFDHPNVLKLLGVCFDTEDQLPIIILPFMSNGDLKSFLRSNRKQPNVKYNDFPPGLTHVKLLYMCLDIAKGMEYLSRKKFVHRDLAARNCIVDHSLNVYVADFGLSRDVYSRDYYRMGIKAAKLPIKWMSPESLNDGLYGEKSDVWSFGVTCWEIFSLGRSPYPAIDNSEVLDHIETGARLKKPALCEEPMYKVMLLCWTLEPEDRATFNELVGSICTLIRESSVQSDEPVNDYFTLEETLDEVIAARNEMKSTAGKGLEENDKVASGGEVTFDNLEAQPYSVPVNASHFDPDPAEGTVEGDILPYAELIDDNVKETPAIGLYEEVQSPNPYSLPNSIDLM